MVAAITPEWRNLSTRGKDGERSRHGHSACVLGGRVHVYAGIEAVKATGAKNYLDDIIVLDPSSLTWKAVRIKGGRPPARVFHTANALGDNANRMVVFGGCALSSKADESAKGDDEQQPNVENLNDVWLYKADGSSWDQCIVAGTPPKGRAAHAAVLLAGSRPQLVVSGGTDGKVAFNDVWLMSIAAPRWELVVTTGPKPSARAYHTCVLGSSASSNQTMITFGGRAMTKLAKP